MYKAGLKLLISLSLMGFLGLATGGCKLECSDGNKTERIIDKIGDNAKEVAREAKKQD